MKTVDEEIRDKTLAFIDKAQDRQQAVLRLAEPDAHARHHPPLATSTRRCATSENGWSEQEAGMAQLDDIVGSVMDHLKASGPRRQHHRRLHHRQRRGELHLARRRADPLRRRQGHGARGRLPRAGDRPLAGQGAGRQGRERHRLRARLVPDAGRGGGQPEHRRRAEGRQGRSTARHFKVHLDGYDQTDADHRQGPVGAPRGLLLHRSRPSRRCGSTTTSTASPTSPTAGSAARSRSTGRSSSTSGSIPSSAPACPAAAARARSPSTTGSPPSSGASCFVQQEVGKAAQSFIDFPPMQKGASFNMEAVKAQIEAAIAAHNVGK